MRVGLLAEEIYRRGSPVYLGGATPECWAKLKTELENLGIEFFAAELRPEDGPVEMLVLTSAAFDTPKVSAVAKRLGLRRSAKQLASFEGCGWVLSMATTAEAEGYRVQASKLWGLLVIESRKEGKSA